MGLKVLHLIDSGGMYGAEKMLLSLVKEQIGLGLEPLILSAGSPGIPEKPIEAECRVGNIPFIAWRMKPGLNIFQSLRIIQWAKSQGFQVLHSHGYKFNVLLAIWPKKIQPLPVVSTLHGYVNSKFPTKMWLYERLDQFLLRRLTRIVLVGGAMRRKPELMLKLKRISPGRIVTIRNGVSAEDLRQSAQNPPPPDLVNFIKTREPLILAIGRLSAEKGLEYLLEAFHVLKGQSEFSAAGLLILGEGRERAALQRKSTELNLDDDILMPGYKPNPAPIIALADIVVMPSLTEGLPIVLLEAMALNSPIVATNVGEIPYVLEGGKCGRLVKPAHGDELADEIRRCWVDKVASRQMASRSYQRIKEKFSERNMACQYIKLYEKAME